MKESTGQEPRKSIKELIYELRKNIVKRKITRNLGKVVETEEKLICYVKKRKCPKDKYRCRIDCYGIKGKDKELAKLYNLDKPICYIFDKINFGSQRNYKHIVINGYNNCEIIIKDCKFYFDIDICVDGKCTIENTYIRLFYTLPIYAGNLIIKDMDINHFLKHGKDLEINLAASQNLEIINSNIGKEKERTSVTMISDEINLTNTKITGDEVCCEAKVMTTDTNSDITASNKVDLKINNLQALKLKSPTINYNNKSLLTETETISLEKEEDPLKLRRLELIELLKQLKNKVDNKNEVTINKCKFSLEAKPISRILSK